MPVIRQKNINKVVREYNRLNDYEKQEFRMHTSLKNVSKELKEDFEKFWNQLSPFGKDDVIEDKKGCGLLVAIEGSTGIKCGQIMLGKRRYCMRCQKENKEVKE